MNFEVIPIPPFDREIKKLSKKYPSLKKEYWKLVESLEKEPIQGVKIGKDCYKIRLSIQSKGKGKSGDARVITCVKIIETKVYLLSIYDKSEKENISNQDLLDLMDFIKF